MQKPKEFMSRGIQQEMLKKLVSQKEKDSRQKYGCSQRNE